MRNQADRSDDEPAALDFAMLDEDPVLRFELSLLPEPTRAELWDAGQDRPGDFYRALALRDDLAAVTHLLSVSDEPQLARLQVLRALRDIRSAT
jgi:hypothetical protein